MAEMLARVHTHTHTHTHTHKVILIDKKEISIVNALLMIDKKDR